MEYNSNNNEKSYSAFSALLSAPPRALVLVDRRPSRGHLLPLTNHCNRRKCLKPQSRCGASQLSPHLKGD